MKNFCVIDIGTNKVKVKIFSNGEYHVLSNGSIGSVDGNVSKDDILKHVKRFMITAKKDYDVKHGNVYIYATAGLRKAPNGEEIKNEIESTVHRRVHILDPRKEARLSILGGLQTIELKKNPKQLLFIESGGGSTEVSLVDMTKRPFSIMATCSLPVGSRDGDKVEDNSGPLYGFCSYLRKKGIKFDDSLQVVMNASGGSRVIAHSLGEETYDAKLIADEQKGVKIADFKAGCKQVLAEKNRDEEFNSKYFLKDEMQEGFVNHVAILEHIVTTLQKNKFNLRDDVEVTTTIGGLKDGLAKEREERLAKEEKTDDKETADNADDRENKDDKKKDNKKEDDKEKNDKKDDDLKLSNVDDDKAEKKGQPLDEKYVESLREHFKEAVKKEEHALYIEDKKADYYKATIHHADGEKLKITAKDKDNINISAKTKSGESKIPRYEDIKNVVLLAKKQGRPISFGNIKSTEAQARLWLACLECKVEMVNPPKIKAREVEKDTLAKINNILDKDENAPDLFARAKKVKLNPPKIAAVKRPEKMLA